MASRDDILKAFRLFDTDGSGKLSAQEIVAILTRTGGGAALTLQDAKEIVEDFDEDEDGELNIEEFAAAFESIFEIAEVDSDDIGDALDAFAGGDVSDDDGDATDELAGSNEPGDEKMSLGSAPTPSLKWGPIRGAKIEVSLDGTTAKDVASNAKTGDDRGGRYRPILGGQGFNQGTHMIKVKLLSRGRILVGVTTGKVKGDWREASKRSLYQVGEAWTVCPPSDCSANMGKWHKNARSATGLPALRVRGILEMVLDCDRHTLTFKVDGSSGQEATFNNLPPGETFYPAVAFGGDQVVGAAVKLMDDTPPQGLGALGRIRPP